MSVPSEPSGHTPKTKGADKALEIPEALGHTACGLSSHENKTATSPRHEKPGPEEYFDPAPPLPVL